MMTDASENPGRCFFVHGKNIFRLIITLDNDIVFQEIMLPIQIGYTGQRQSTM